MSVRAQAGADVGESTPEQVDADVREAVGHAEQSGDPAVRAYVLGLSGWTLIRSRSIAAGCRLLERAVELCEAGGISFHLPAAHGILGLWPVWAGDLDRSRSHAHHAVELSRQVGRPAWEAIGLAGVGAAALIAGDHEQARDSLSRAESVLRARSLDGSPYEQWVRPWLAWTAYRSGDMEGARASAEKIARIGRGSGSRWDEALGESLLGAITLADDQVGEARMHFEASRALAADPGLPFPLGRSLLGMAELARQEEDWMGARELAHEALEVLQGYGDVIGTAAALEALADVATPLGQPERALRLLSASQRFHVDAGIARIPHQSDRFDRARGAARAALHPDAAAGPWDEGDSLSLSEAVAYARRGRGKHPRARIGWGALTPAEVSVVRLVAEGCTNADIGRRLFISVNTVKKHLTHVYAKVDVGGRADLAAQAARRGL